MVDVRCLVVDNDVTAADDLSAKLGSDVTTMDQARSGQEALDRISRQNYDAAFVEIVLPDIEGYEVIRTIRNGGSNVPVLIISGLSKPEATVRGLRAGADDFITKPFEADELRARVQAVVRRSTPSPRQPLLGVGSLQLNLDACEVTVGDQPVRVTGKEFAVLEFLVQRRGCTVTKAAILTHLYGGMDVPEPKIIDVFICKVRKKLMQAGADDLIRTVSGHGYRFCGAPI